jgi:pyruvate dehydrogenase E1 component
LAEIVDGEYQKYSVSDGAYIRQKLFGKHPELLDLVSHFPMNKLQISHAVGTTNSKFTTDFIKPPPPKTSPQCCLVKTVKGFGLGSAGAGQNSTHQKKKLDADTIVQSCVIVSNSILRILIWKKFHLQTRCFQSGNAIHA